MNLKRHILYLVLGAFMTLVAFTACQNPIALHRTGSNGVISVAIQRVSPLATTMLQPSTTGLTATVAAASDLMNSTLSSGQTQTSLLSKSIGSRTFLAADEVDFTLYDSNNNVASTWTYPTSTDTFTNSTLSISSQNVPPGSNYTLQADIYNYNNATGSQLTASGVSAPFSVTAGGSASVSIICLPYNPPALTVNGGTTTVSLLPWVADPTSSGSPSPYTVTTTGSEQWYQVSLTGGTTYVVSASGTSVNYAVVGVFDSSGTSGPLGYGESDLGGEPSVISVTPPSSGTYYIAVMERVDSTSSSASNPTAESVTVGITSIASTDPPQPVFEFAYPNDPTTEAVLLYWVASPAQTSFAVLRDTGSGTAQTDVTAAGTNGYYQDTTSGRWYFIDSTAAYGTYYRYQVVALDASQNPIAGTYSSFVNAPLTAPTSVSALTNGAGNGIDVSWSSVSGALAYYVEIVDASGNLVVDASTVSTSYSFANSGYFTNGTTYYVAVAGYANNFGYFNVTSVTYTGS